MPVYYIRHLAKVLLSIIYCILKQVSSFKVTMFKVYIVFLRVAF